MQEELGVKVPLVHMKTFLSSNATMGHLWAVYLGELPLDWNFSPNAEVASVVKMSTKEIYEKLKLSPVEGSSIDLENYFNKANSDDPPLKLTPI